MGFFNSTDMIKLLKYRGLLPPSWSKDIKDDKDKE
jgi:hypothetical protein